MAHIDSSYPEIRIYTFGTFSVERLITTPSSSEQPRYEQIAKEEWRSRGPAISLLKLLFCLGFSRPLLVAEREAGKHGRIVGTDNRQEAITLSQNMARLAKINNVEFIQSDLLTPDFTKLGSFDTVAAIHLIEHIPEDKLPDALTNLLKVTRRRLLIAVPYEQQAEIAYGHEQVFSHEKLEKWGNWCVAQMKGEGKAFCEDVMGGILVVEREGQKD